MPRSRVLLYVTPHRWTPYYETVAGREVVEDDTRKWDYKRQVLATRRVPPWRVLMWVKLIEVGLQLRPKALGRLLFGRDADFRHAMRWYTRIGRRVWSREIFEWLFGGAPQPTGQSLREFAGESLAADEYALARPGKPVLIRIPEAPACPRGASRPEALAA
jgi:anaerobic magnesium-protoporphyrin IX monomethyl ester cyclase